MKYQHGSTSLPFRALNPTKTSRSQKRNPKVLANKAPVWRQSQGAYASSKEKENRCVSYSGCWARYMEATKNDVLRDWRRPAQTPSLWCGAGKRRWQHSLLDNHRRFCTDCCPNDVLLPWQQRFSLTIGHPRAADSRRGYCGHIPTLSRLYNVLYRLTKAQATGRYTTQRKSRVLTFRARYVSTWRCDCQVT